VTMASDIEAASASRPWGSGWKDWLLFPGGLVSQNRQIERGLAALIWVAMPFVLYLLRTHPGGFGGLITEPVYFFLAVLYLATVVVVTYIALWGLTRLVPAEDVDTNRSRRKIALRAWMDAIISCFALTAIVLSASIWISMEWLQDRGNRVTIDVFSLMLNLDESDWRLHLIGYGYALFAALAIGFIVRRMTRKTHAADTPRAETLSQARNPIVFLVALIAYVVLTMSMALTELRIP
jgi:hypothetical protein